MGLFPSNLCGDQSFKRENISENLSQTSGFPKKSAKKFNLNMNNILLNDEYFFKDEEEKNENIHHNIFKKEIIKDISHDNKNKINKNERNYGNINEENVEKFLNKKSPKKKFFNDYNFELKCSCSKTQCNKLYCECFRLKRYCANCKCKNCLNRPIDCSINDIKGNNNDKGKKLSCICSKSGCILKYCECYKSGVECTDLCRCIKCKNSKNTKKINIKLNKVCYINSIYIVDNEIFQENRIKSNKKFINSFKRKRSGKKMNKKGKEINKKANISEVNTNDSLFDKNGKIIFKHIKFSKFDT